MLISTLFPRILFNLDAGAGGGAPAADTSAPAGDVKPVADAPATEPKGGNEAPAAAATTTADPAPKDGGDKPAATGNMPDYSITPELKNWLMGGITDAKSKERAEKWLGTRQSIKDLFTGAYNADSKINELTSSRIKVPTGKDDDPKEVERFRKAMGIPESPDKYAVWTPEGMQLEPADKELWDEALKDFHASKIGQAGVDTIAKVYYRAQQTAQKALADRAKAAAEKAQEDLRVEYGRDMKPNIELAERWLKENAPGLRDGDGQRILDKRFADGTALGEHPAFVKLIVGLAKQAADDGALVVGETTEGTDVDKRIDELMGLMATDKAKYQSKAVQDELARLTRIQLQRSGQRA